MSVVQDLLDHVWLRNRGNDPQPATAFGTLGNIDFENAF